MVDQHKEDNIFLWLAERQEAYWAVPVADFWTSATKMPVFFTRNLQ